MANVNTADFVSPSSSMPNNFVTGPSAFSGGLAGSSTPTQVGSAGSDGSMLGALGSVLNLIPGVGPILGGIASTISQGIQNKRNREFEQQEAAAQRAWNEQMMDKQNQFSLDMWNKTNEYNSPAAQVQRLRDAGLNPLYYGLDGTSANAFQSAQAMGYDRASVGNQVNPFSTGLESGIQMRSLQKDIELKNAQIDQLGATTEGIKLDNEFKDRTMDARVQAESLANSLTKEQIDKIKSEKRQIEENIKKIIAETKNEALKGLLIEAQTNLAKMQEKEIAELLPYQKLLMEAQTTAQKAAAAASFANAAINNGLLSAGYVDKLIAQIEAQTEASKAAKRNNEAAAALNEFKMSIRNGTLFDTSDSGIPKGKGQMFVENFLSGFFQSIAIIGDAFGGLGAAVIGAGIGAAGSSTPGHTSVSFGAAMGK